MKGGGVRVVDGRFVPDGRSAVGAKEAELADYLNLTGAHARDFYLMLKKPYDLSPSVRQDGARKTFGMICMTLSQSQLRHVGELLAHVIQARIAEIRKKQHLRHSFTPGSPEHLAEVEITSKHLHTLAMFMVARKAAAYLFRKRNREPDATNPDPILMDYGRMDLFTFLTKAAPDKQVDVNTYDELKQNLDMLPRTDFKRVKTTTTRRKMSDDERTSSYSDDRAHPISMYERAPVATNATRKIANAERRAERLEEEARVRRKEENKGQLYSKILKMNLSDKENAGVVPSSASTRSALSPRPSAPSPRQMLSPKSSVLSKSSATSQSSAPTRMPTTNKNKRK